MADTSHASTVLCGCCVDCCVDFARARTGGWRRAWERRGSALPMRRSRRDRALHAVLSLSGRAELRCERHCFESPQRTHF